jgi:predicted patatin/cPLA2 family phospholipase
LIPAKLLSAILVGLALMACAGPTVESLRDPVPEPLVTRSAVPGYSRIRYWGDNGDGLSPDIVAEVAAQQKAAGMTSPDRYYLAVSGGGSNGAFGAGVLFGWTAAGTRPEFTIVTGISTGSLIAPFAFLGPPYDERLKEAYTEVSGEDVYEKKGVLRIIGSESVADNTPLRRLVSRYVTDQMLADIVREHKRGRRLLVGTTNLDAERPVVWDIGGIAASGVPGRKQLIQDILVASASIPGVFPPVNIKVVADGKTYDEMHVDGGTSNQAFMFPSNFSVKQNDKQLKRGKMNRTLYVLRNGKITPEYSTVKPKLASIVGKSISSLIKTQGIGDLYRMYANAQRDGIAFRAIWIPESFTQKEPKPFDPAYMRALFDLGYQMGRGGIPWESQPP